MKKEVCYKKQKVLLWMNNLHIFKYVYFFASWSRLVNDEIQLLFLWDFIWKLRFKVSMGRILFGDIGGVFVPRYIYVLKTC